jgi:predicted aconitase
MLSFSSAAMKLTDEEKGLLYGSQGPARQKATELLVRYGEALGAERMIETGNVISAVNAPYRAASAGLPPAWPAPGRGRSSSMR